MNDRTSAVKGVREIVRRFKWYTITVNYDINLTSYHLTKFIYPVVIIYNILALVN